MSAVQTSTPEPTGWMKVLKPEDLTGRRRPLWRHELTAWARLRLGAPFQWGLSDCALLGFQAVDIQLGTKLWLQHRFRYSTALGAMRYQLRYGIDPVRVIEAAGCTPIDPALAQTGDLLSGERDGFLHLHVCIDERWTVSAWLDRGVAAMDKRFVQELRDVKAYTCGP